MAGKNFVDCNSFLAVIKLCECRLEERYFPRDSGNVNERHELKMGITMNKQAQLVIFYKTSVHQ
ncbi:MAG: hypothetical protein EA411_06810 [Saprospirales bacterium]|nr:MAG: hypothetical protein EA411_06810 [Saprospirales bacterium]